MNKTLAGNYVFPASSDQERLWFLDQFDERLGAAYNISTAFKINHVFDRVALQKALNDLVSRHESLRTSFQVADSYLKQIIKPHLTITIRYYDCLSGEENQRINFVLEAINSEAKQSFDLSEPGLLKLVLYQTKTDEYYLLIILHHCIADGVSLEIFIQELFCLYRKYMEGGKPFLSNLQYQFVDVVDWLNKSLIEERYQEHAVYWQKQLLNAPQNISLPADKVRPDEPNYAGHNIIFHLDNKAIFSIKNTAKQTLTTTYVVLLTALAINIYQYTRKQDFLIGIPVANRSEEEMQNVIGFLANTIVIRVKISDGQTIKTLLKDIHKTVSEAIKYQQFPYNKIVEIVKPERKINVNSIFQTMFGFQEISSPKLNLDIDTDYVERLVVNNGLSRVDLSFFLISEKDEINGIVEYSTELYSDQYIEKFIQRYIAICECIEDNLECHVNDICEYLFPTKGNSIVDPNKGRDHFDKPFFIMMPEKMPPNTESVFNEKSSMSEKTATEIEKKLDSIWRNLLFLAQDLTISVTDNFFELGGNSLLVARLVDEIQKEFGVVISMKTIFLTPTILSLGKNIELLTNDSKLVIANDLSKFMSIKEKEMLEELFES